MRRVALALVALGIVAAGLSLSLGGSSNEGLLAPLGCGADATTNLQSIFNKSNTTINLPTNACYTVNGSIRIDSSTNLTINGNGATLTQTVPASTSAKRPVLLLTQDTNLTINGLNISGAFNGSNGGPGREGQYGWLMEADHGVTMTGDSISNVQGDFFNLQFPDPAILPGVQDLNTGIRVTNSHFLNAGYHMVTMESVGPGPGSVNNLGALISNDTFDNASTVTPATDAIDLEYDIYSSGTPDARGIATYAAEDNITFSGDEWSGFRVDFFASLQGQTPGVQERNVVISANTINNPNNSYDLGEVLGTAQATTTAPYIFQGLTFTGNTSHDPSSCVHSCSIATPNSGQAFIAQNVTAMKLTGNHLLVFDGTCTPFVYFCNNGAKQPFQGLILATNILGLSLMNNNFDGALGVLHPDSASNSYGVICGNHYGANGSMLDSAC